MKKLLLAVVFWGACNSAFSQMNFHPIGGAPGVTSLQTAPVIQWQNTIGGSGDDRLYSAIQQTADGGYILGGWSASTISGDKAEDSIGGYDYWIVKTDSAGNIQWQNTIGGNANDEVWSIRQTTDGGYILGGWSASDSSGDKTENCIGTPGYFDYWIVKTDALGNIQWQNTIGGNNTDELISILQTTDGGYILGGLSISNISGDKTENSMGGYDYWIVKTDAFGNIQWQNTIGGSNNDAFYSIQQTADGGYILGGWSASGVSGDKTENNIGGTDYWTVKTDALGNIQWQNTIGGNDADVLRSIQQTADGGYILGGYSQSNISGDKTENNVDSTCIACLPDYWIVKTDATGNIQWQNTIGGGGIDYLYTVQQTADGGYILGGTSWSDISGDKTENTIGLNYFADYWIVKTDSAGNIQWQNTIGGSNGEELWSIEQTAADGYIIGGTSYSGISGDKTENCMGVADYWIIKLIPPPPCSTAPTSINLSTNDTICSGQPVTLAQVGGVLSANGAFRWYADSCGGTSIGTGYTIILLPTATTTYYVRAEDSCGVTACASITITVNPSPAPPAITGINTFCQGGSSTLNAGGGYTCYIWSTAATTQIINLVTGGTYTVTVCTANGCTASASITVTVNPLPIVNLGPDVSICSGNSVQLIATGFLTYLWSTGANTPTINVSTTGTYTVTVTDVNGCTGSDNVTVTVNPNPVPVITGNTTICNGSNTVLDAGAGYSNYVWSTGSGLQTINVATAGVYTVTVTDVNGCTGSDNVTVTVLPLPTAMMTGTANICVGQSATLTIVFTGPGPWNYAYNTPQGVVNAFAASTPIAIPVSPLTTFNYTMVAVSNPNCTGSVTGNALITVYPLPTATISGNANICIGSCTNLSVSFTGTMPFIYSYSNGTTTFGPFTTSANPQVINVCPTVSTTYTLTAISDANCTGTVGGAAIVTVNPNPVAVITPSSTVFMCSDDTAHFTANTGAGFMYQWYKNSIAIAGAVNSFYDATANGLYSFVVTDLNGCFGTSASTQVQIICQPADTNLGLRMGSVSANDIVLVPNPASTEITIHSESVIQSIVIYDAIGQKVFETKLNASSLQIPISNFHNGIYFVEVINGKQKSINKFIKN